MERQIGNNLSSGAEKTEALAEQAEREAADVRFEAAKSRAAPSSYLRVVTPFSVFSKTGKIFLDVFL